MATTKGRKATPKGRKATPNTPTPTEAPTAPTATFVAPVPVAPANKRGASTVANPVGVAWVTCLNATAANGGTPPARATLHRAVMAEGVAYYTTRTQVQRYLAWHRAGANPADLPRGVVLG